MDVVSARAAVATVALYVVPGANDGRARRQGVPCAQWVGPRWGAGVQYEMTSLTTKTPGPSSKKSHPRPPSTFFFYVSPLRQRG